MTAANDEAITHRENILTLRSAGTIIPVFGATVMRGSGWKYCWAQIEPRMSDYAQ